MLRTASRHSLSKRSSSSHSFSALRHQNHPLYYRSGEWIVCVGNNAPRADFAAIRLLSTSQVYRYPKESSTFTKSGEPPLPPPTPPIKKAKVGLRPGPIKPGKTDAKAKLTSGSVQASPSTSNSSLEKPTQSADVTREPTAESSTGIFGGIFDQTKEDVRDAVLKGVLKPPPADAPKWRVLFHQGIEIFKFYFRGLKLIYSHNTQVRAIRRRVRNGGEPLTRWESRFIRTHHQDLLKMVPFLLVMLVIEEIIPLIVIYAPFLLPSTCILPAQRLRIDTKRIDKQAEARNEGIDAFDALRSAAPSTSHIPVSLLSTGNSAVFISKLLGLPAFSPIPGWRRHLVVKRLKYLAEDDALLLQEGNGERLTRPELREALLERGIILDGLTDTQIASRLKWWLGNINGDEGDAISRRLMLVAQAAAMR